VSKIEQPPKMMGRRMTMLLAPDKSGRDAKDARAAREAKAAEAAADPANG